MIDEKKLIEEIEEEAKKDPRLGLSSYIPLRAMKEMVDSQPKIGEWIPCSERLPEEHDSIFAKLKGTEKWIDAMFEKTSNKVEVTVEFEDGTRKTTTAHTFDGKWKVDAFVKLKVIAWKDFSEPYSETI